MTHRLRRRAFHALDRRRLRRATGLIRSAEILVRDRELCLVSPDRDGGWRLRARACILVGPQPNLPPPRRLRARTLDVFCHGYRPRPGDTVLDVGAGIGREALVFCDLVGPDGSVHCVEPHAGAFGFLLRVRELNRLANLRCHRLAIMEAGGTRAVSTEPDVDRYYRNRIVFDGEGPPVPAKTIADLVGGEEIDTVDLLVMNIEGGEREALADIGPVADRIRNVAIACHDFLADLTGDETLRTKEGVRAALAAHGFELSERPEDPRPWLRDFVYGARG